jgi:hypothetical protein
VFSRAAAILVLALTLTVPVTGGDGAPADALELIDLQDRIVRPLAEAEDSTLVFLFARTDCPISNRYAPEIRRLHERFAARGVRFVLVYPDPDETPDAIRRHLEEYAYEIDPLRDPEQRLVRLTGVQVTPEAALFSRGRLVYRGRIDDLYVDFGKRRAAPTTHDLEQALEATLAGRAVENPTTKAVGCYIPTQQ